MRALWATIVALLLAALLGGAGVASAQSAVPLTQLLTDDDLSQTFEGLWTGACTAFGDSVTCNFGQTPDEGGGQVRLVMRIPIPGSGTSSQTLEGWRSAILEAARSAGHPTEPVPDVGDEAYLVDADPVYHLEFFSGGMTGSLQAAVPGASPGSNMTALARTALSRLGVAPGARSPAPVVSIAPLPTAATIAVPTFTGLTLDDARALALQVGLRLTVRTDETSDQPPGTVTSQQPGPGTQARAGDSGRHRRRRRARVRGARQDPAARTIGSGRDPRPGRALGRRAPDRHGRVQRRGRRMVGRLQTVDAHRHLRVRPG